MSEFEDPSIAVIGGGTGSFTLLQELKDFTPNISALVNMCDDGGSTGRLRDELGVLPPGDVRQCLVALSNDPEARDLFAYRFGDGDLSGHSLGNLVLAGLELQHNDFAKAVKVAGSILKITGEVVPITTDKHTLVMQDGDESIRSEFVIGHRAINSKNTVLSLDPRANIHPEADRAIRGADLVVIAPGNLYGSLLPAFAVDGVKEAIQERRGKTVVVSNLVTKPGQTDDWHVVDYIKAFEQYIGEGQVDYALFNDQLPSDELLRRYAADGEFPVSVDSERFSEVLAVSIGDRLIADSIYLADAKDKSVPRTLIRHNAITVGQNLMAIYKDRLRIPQNLAVNG